MPHPIAPCRRLLILACSATKRGRPIRIPARDRYDGPLWRTLRSADPDGCKAKVAFLSARFGFRDADTPIDDYDARLTADLAQRMIDGGMTTRWPRPPSARGPDTFGMHPGAEIASLSLTRQGRIPFDDVALVGGRLYVEVMRAFVAGFQRMECVRPDARITEIVAPIGIMRQRMKAWLNEFDGGGTLMTAFFHHDPNDGIRLRALSLGAGVQSTTLALMAAHSEIGPMPDIAIFADTGWEPRRVYEHLEWLSSPNVLPFPVHVVSAGNIRENLMRGARGKRWAPIPAFSKTVTPAGTKVLQYGDDADGEQVPVGYRTLTRDEVEIGIITRQCTTEHKIVPIRRHVRILSGLAGKPSPDAAVVEQWIGISLDEAIRMKPSFETWQVNRWPLIEKRMSRADCLGWLMQHGYPTPPKSACIGCPFHSNERWRQIRDDNPEEWADVVRIDRRIRTGFRGMRAELFLHRSCVPLDQADLSDSAAQGQGDLFANDCEGMCGV